MYFKAHVLPDSTAEYVKAVSADTFARAVREKARAGRANKRLLELLRAHFGDGKKIRIVSGHQSSHKIIAVD